MNTHIIGSDQVFTSAERLVIETIAKATIEADDARGLPSASDPEVMAVILGKAALFESRIKTGIEYLCSVLDPNSVSAADLLEKLENDPRLQSLSKILTIVIMQSYYQTPRVLTALGLPARPPFPLGHKLEPDDWSLLEVVKKRAPFYRRV